MRYRGISSHKLPQLELRSLPVGVLLVHRQSPRLDGGPRRGAAHVQPHVDVYRPSPIIPTSDPNGAPGGHGQHGEDDRERLGHVQVSGRAVDEAQRAVAAVGIGRVRERKVGGRERVDRERVERAITVVLCVVRRAVKSFSTAPARAPSQTCSMSRAHV